MLRNKSSLFFFIVLIVLTPFLGFFIFTLSDTIFERESITLFEHSIEGEAGLIDRGLEPITDEVSEEETTEVVSDPILDTMIHTFQEKLRDSDFTTDASKYSIDFDSILSGGPGKDGIPAINDPKFESSDDVIVSDDTRGILVEVDGVQRFYPYNILVWHEIVNDQIGDTHFSVTFCPLCDSGIVFDRVVEGEILQFGVSGFLYESNLLMYDTKTESLWSQSLGEAVVGEYTGTTLDILPLQVITFSELKEKYEDAVVLSNETGFFRNYAQAPYGNYLETDEVLFPISVSDTRFFMKDLFYIIPIEDISYALPYQQVRDGERTFVSSEGAKTFSIDGGELEIVRDGSEIRASYNGVMVPGYFELWFSWAVGHQENGVVLQD